MVYVQLNLFGLVYYQPSPFSLSLRTVNKRFLRKTENKHYTEITFLVHCPRGKGLQGHLQLIYDHYSHFSITSSNIYMLHQLNRLITKYTSSWIRTMDHQITLLRSVTTAQLPHYLYTLASSLPLQTNYSLHLH